MTQLLMSQDEDVDDMLFLLQDEDVHDIREALEEALTPHQPL